MKKILITIIGLIISHSLLSSASAYEFQFSEETIQIEPSGEVYLSANKLDHDLLKLTVKAKDMTTGIIGIAFHLKYDKSKLSFLKYLPGSFLEKGGDPFYLVKNDSQNGKIIFGETLRRDDSFPTGAGNIAEFYFQSKGERPYEFKFEKAVVSSMDETRQDLDKVVFKDMTIDTQKEEKNIDYSSKENKHLQANSSNSIEEGKTPYALIGLLSIFAIISLVLIIRLIKKRQLKGSLSVNFK